MIRIILLGRTGNNLFQYALGRVLAQKHGVPLVVDGSWFNGEGWSEVSHGLRLAAEARVVRRFSLGARLLRRVTGKHYWEYRGVPLLKEPTHDQSFDARFLEAPADCVLFGYFQSPRYFHGIAEPLRQQLNDALGAAVTAPADLLRQLDSPSSVAVHVRRTDYLQLPAFRVCGREYYREAMHLLRVRVPGTRFYVFSDDVDWCRREFVDADTAVVDCGAAAANPLHDLHLMSRASHHLIANSSYSWWAAWLGRKPDQQVMVPPRWYARDIKAPIGDKILDHWTVVQDENAYGS